MRLARGRLRRSQAAQKFVQSSSAFLRDLYWLSANGGATHRNARRRGGEADGKKLGRPQPAAARTCPRRDMKADKRNRSTRPSSPSWPVFCRPSLGAERPAQRAVTLIISVT